MWHCAGPDYPLCRCTMGGVPRRKGAPPTSCQIFTTLFWRLNVQSTLKSNDDWKKVVNFWGKKCTATDKKILASRMRKGPPPYVGMGLPEWLIRPWHCDSLYTTYTEITGQDRMTNHDVHLDFRSRLFNSHTYLKSLTLTIWTYYHGVVFFNVLQSELVIFMIIRIIGISIYLLKSQNANYADHHREETKELIKLRVLKVQKV